MGAAIYLMYSNSFNEVVRKFEDYVKIPNSNDKSPIDSFLNNTFLNNRAQVAASAIRINGISLEAFKST
jgi:hypothetical protein